MNEKSPIRVKSFQFACEIVLYSDALKEKRRYEIASQLLKSGTSIGAKGRHNVVSALKILKINLESL